MHVRSRVVLAVLPFALLSLAPLARASNNSAELQDQLKAAADAGTPDVAGLKPWHAKISIQLNRQGNRMPGMINQ